MTKAGKRSVSRQPRQSTWIAAAASAVLGIACAGAPAAKAPSDQRRDCASGSDIACGALLDRWVDQDVRADARAAQAAADLAIVEAQCEKSVASACAAASHLHRVGLHGASDPAKARAFLVRSWDLGELGRRANDGPSVESLRRARIACDAGGGRACRQVGQALMAGRWGASKDPAQALAFFDRSCQHGDAYGCYQAADQKLILNRPQEAAAAFKSTCDAGGAHGCYGLAWVAEKAGNRAEALAQAEKGCGLGASAACRLQGLLLGGDSDRGQDLLVRACEGADAAACSARAASLAKSPDGVSLSAGVIAAVTACEGADGAACSLLKGAFADRIKSESLSDEAMAALSRSCEDTTTDASCQLAAAATRATDARAQAKKEADEKARTAQLKEANHASACALLKKPGSIKDDELASAVEACPDGASEADKAAARRVRLMSEIDAAYAAAKDKGSGELRAFYQRFYETGDPRVEELRKAAVKRFGPDKPAQFVAARRSVQAMSSKHFFADLCDVRNGEAVAAVNMSFAAAALTLGSLVVGGHDSSHFRQKVDALGESKSRVSAAIKGRTGAKSVSFMLMGNCSVDHWYLDGRPWPPPRKPVRKATP